MTKYATKSATSSRQSHGHLSRTKIMKVGKVICVTDFHDLRPRQVYDFVGNSSRTLSQSRRNGIWALANLLMTLQNCRKDVR